MSKTFEEDVSNVYDDAEMVLLRKHQDYGPKNISDSPGGPLNGLRVRMHDKLARINNLIDSGAAPENESLRDSFLDLMNYSAIAMLVLDGHWPSAATDVTLETSAEVHEDYLPGSWRHTPGPNCPGCAAAMEATK